MKDWESNQKKCPHYKLAGGSLPWLCFKRSSCHRRGLFLSGTFPSRAPLPSRSCSGCPGKSQNCSMVQVSWVVRKVILSREGERLLHSLPAWLWHLDVQSCGTGASFSSWALAPPLWGVGLARGHFSPGSAFVVMLGGPDLLPLWALDPSVVNQGQGKFGPSEL